MKEEEEEDNKRKTNSLPFFCLCVCVCLRQNFAKILYHANVANRGVGIYLPNPGGTPGFTFHNTNFLLNLQILFFGLKYEQQQIISLVTCFPGTWDLEQEYSSLRDVI